MGTKLAHHAVHNTKAAGAVLKMFIPEGIFQYTYHRLRHLKESWKQNKAFGSRTFRPMTVNLGFDTKRNLDGNKEGWSKPWKDINERAQSGKIEPDKEVIHG